MPPLPDILSYAVFTGFQFAALCVMTRDGRGWPWRVLALTVLIATDTLVEWGWHFARMPIEQWLAICFALKWSVLTVLVLVLSRDSLGRRVFLSVAYGAYAIGFGVIFHLVACRNVLGASKFLAVAAGLAVVSALNLVLIFWILPLMPCDDRDSRWRTPCLAAFVMAATMYVCGFWPVSVITSPARDGAAFWLMLVGVWVSFPAICRSVRERQHNTAVGRNLDLMMAEVKVRRAALDEARRIHHDRRHHHVQLGEYLLRGQYDRAISYLKEMDDELDEIRTNKLVWCENETVNAILSGCVAKAEEKGVDLVAEAHVEQEIALPDVEVVAVVANLIENAIEASAKELEFRVGVGERNLASCTATPLAGGQQEGGLHSPTQDSSSSLPRVTVVLRQHEFGIGIAVTNPVSTGFALSSNGLPCALPGFGLESVRRMVERHHGEWAYELNDGCLTCRVALMFGEGACV